jgi:hypothetical protein
MTMARPRRKKGYRKKVMLVVDSVWKLHAHHAQMGWTSADKASIDSAPEQSLKFVNKLPNRLGGMQ